MDGVSSSALGLSSGSRERSGADEASLPERLRGLWNDLRRRVDRFLNADDAPASESDAASNPVDDPATPIEMDRFPDRAHPLTYPGRDMIDINTPDAVGIETEEGLRVSVPENPDATIVSDRWVPIER